MQVNRPSTLGTNPVFTSAFSRQLRNPAFRALWFTEESIFTAMKIMRQSRQNTASLTTSFKAGPNDWLTNADLSIQELVVKNISRAFPGHKFIAEEANLDASLRADRDSNDYWSVDPIDGTSCFARSGFNGDGPTNPLLEGFVQFGVMMAYLHKGWPKYAAFAAPEMDLDGRGYSIFQAVEGIDGVFLNGQRVDFAASGQLQNSLAIMALKKHPQETAIREAVSRHFEIGKVIPSSASAGSELSLLIARPPQIANFNLYLTSRMFPWDFIPGAYLVLKASGLVKYINGEDVFPFSFDHLKYNGRAEAIVAGSAENVTAVLDFIRHQ